MNRRKNILTLIAILFLVVAGVFATRYVHGQMHNEKGNETLFADAVKQTTDDEQSGQTLINEDTVEDKIARDNTTNDKTSDYTADKKNTSTDKKDTTSKKDASDHQKGSLDDKKTSTKKKTLSCTLTIRCDSLLEHMDQLDSAKRKYVPQSGYILKETKVTFTSGETVFDVLRRECKTRKIQIEYSWTPVYNSYYIEGIQQLYEFDCGYESGWVYRVDGGSPNYGASEYCLKGGESIVWAYTCEGQGADIESESR